MSVTEILQSKMPDDLAPNASLPGVRPISNGQWLHVDDAYAAQLAYRRRLIAQNADTVIWQEDEASPAVEELFDSVLRVLPGLGFEVGPELIKCPDGYHLSIGNDRKLAALGKIVQEDFCLLERRGEEHVLTAAVLCFPASWSLSEKAGKPLSRIHQPVAEYDEQITKRVQRLFDGVQVGKPLWRNNMLRYENPDLHQPRSETFPERRAPASGGYIRAERQCIVRLPDTKAVVFSIHSYVVRAE